MVLSDSQFGSIDGKRGLAAYDALCWSIRISSGWSDQQKRYDRDSILIFRLDLVKRISAEVLSRNELGMIVNIRNTNCLGRNIGDACNTWCKYQVFYKSTCKWHCDCLSTKLWWHGMLRSWTLTRLRGWYKASVNTWKHPNLDLNRTKGLVYILSVWQGL